MAFELMLYQYPLFSAAVLALILVAYILSRRQSQGVPAFLFLLTTAVLWSLGAAFENGALTYSFKVLWHKIGQTGLIWIPLAWLLFLNQVVRPINWQRYRINFWICLPPTLFTLLVWTNEFHHWSWTALQMRPGSAAQSLLVQYGFAGILNIIYAYLLQTGAIVLLIVGFRTASAQQRGQRVVLIISTLLTWSAHLIYVFSLARRLPIDPTPALFNITALVFTYGMYRYRLLNLIPISYQNMIAGMEDGILVINPNHMIVHMNPAAEKIIGQSLKAVAGLPGKQVLANFPVLIEHCCKTIQDFREDIVLDTPEGVRNYEVRFTMLRDRYQSPIGSLMILRDISERIRAEVISQQTQLFLKQSEESFRALVENVDEIFATLDSTGIITYASPVIERYTGYPPEAVIGQRPQQFLHDEDRLFVDTFVKEALNGKVNEDEFRVIDRDGNLHYMHMHNYPLYRDNIPVGVQVVISDETKERQTKQSLERRAAQLTMLNFIGEQIASAIELDTLLDIAPRLMQQHFGYSHIAIFTPDADKTHLVMRSSSGSITDCFPSENQLPFGQGIVGWVAEHQKTLLTNNVYQEPRYINIYPEKVTSCAELAVPILANTILLGILDIQSPIINAFDEDDVLVMETVADQMAVALENARLYDEARLRLQEREREENMLRIQRDLLLRLSPARSLEDTLLTALKTLGRALSADQAGLRLINNGSPDLIRGLRFDQESHTSSLLAPPYWIDTEISQWVVQTGQPVLFSKDDANPHAFQLPEDIVAIMCAPLITNGRVSGIISIASQQANAFALDDQRLLITLADSLVILIERARLFEEVESARMELEERANALEKVNASLREMDRLKSQFLANVSHELRTPLNSIIGFSETLVDGLSGPVNAEQQEFLGDILESGRHLLALINDLLDFSKIKEGGMQFSFAAFDVCALFAELHNTLLPLVEKGQQTMFIETEEDLPDLVGDRLRIKQVLLNLLSNANKFTPPRGTIRLAARMQLPDQMIIEVQDTGVGIRPEDQAMIFEEFRQVDGSLTRETAGAGLGLAISKRIVEMHQGRIWVESTSGWGTVFTVCLPQTGPNLLNETNVHQDAS